MLFKYRAKHLNVSFIGNLLQLETTTMQFILLIVDLCSTIM